MKLLLDINVLLDVLLIRQPHVGASAKVLDACERHLAEGWLCAASLTTLYYLATKERDRATAQRLLEKLLSFCTVAEVNDAVIRRASGAVWDDFEDAVVHEAAVGGRCDGIVTRDAGGFKKASLPVYKPEDVCSLLNL